MRLLIPEIKEIKKYSVEFKGNTKIFESKTEASSYRKHCEIEMVHDYMDSLGIPSKGLYIVWANKTSTPRQSHPAVIIFDNKCVAYGEYKDGKLLSNGHATEWLDDHITGLDLNDFLDSFDKNYRVLLSGKHINTSSAFKEVWGNDDDGIVDFEKTMHPDVTIEGVNVIKVED